MTPPTLELEQMLSSTPAGSRYRDCFLLRVRPERLAEYVDVHQAVWPEMLAALSAAGWRNYSLFLQPGTGMVVGYFESDDVEAARRVMADTEVNTRWQAEMAPYFQLPDGGTDERLRQYFYLQ
ncbi:L-rhamnose mutarotase [Raineyella antarctica]|uniref:L-rhamnose mutarotase n=1 Tax=Raineyella antarctica TaxID=1577474 RepID=A0A1G6GID2_9ACTN|nr:L-rhamnose mutarotase [Raineyella antarctica]SDB81669.1 L-rhamnose mutarotase [Raineyella antarctica]